MDRPKAVVAWSSGKDCAWALHEVQRADEVEVVGLLTTVTETFGRVSMHAVREVLLDLQAEALGLPCLKVRIPWPCPNGRYEAAMADALGELRAGGVSQVIFGDLFLPEVRAHREERMAGSGLEPRFPLWGRDTAQLVRQMLAGGLRATVTCVDPRRLAPDLAGRAFDESLLAALPAGVDPCGEHGEFHTFAWAGPMFRAPLQVVTGEVVERDGFVFADLLPVGAGTPGDR